MSNFGGYGYLMNLTHRQPLGEEKNLITNKQKHEYGKTGRREGVGRNEAVPADDES